MTARRKAIHNAKEAWWLMSRRGTLDTRLISTADGYVWKDDNGWLVKLHNNGNLDHAWHGKDIQW